MKRNIVVFVIIAPLMAVMLSLAKAYYYFDVWQYEGEDVVFQVQPGEGFSSINHRLDRAGLIGSTKVFYRYCQLKNLMTKFKSGHYEIPTGSTMRDIINLLLYGRPITVELTIPEGKNFYEIAALLEANGFISKAQDFVKLARDPAMLRQLNITNETVEGYLYPDTYKFDPHQSAAQIMRVMVEEFRQKTKSLDYSKSTLTPEQVLILASVVEKETGARAERSRIAGVFFNRLKKKMRLQSDPTTIYGIWEQFKGNLKKEHLQEVTPYNTYRINGLPKGPICNPGLDAIRAVLTPERHDYLYFVSKNDGTHVFTKTYAEHLQAVEIWQVTRQNREGKSWRQMKQN
ncbi:MAG: endolytic transglycosylase MltG [Bdellovibrio sp.]|nr:endolytic transglycosylase MltG [Bdellovibrio sp.]